MILIHRQYAVYFFLVICFLFSSQSFAFEFVDDISANTKLLQALQADAARLSELKQQYENMQKRLQTVQNIQQDAEGHYGYGSMLNDGQALKDREWSPGNWNDTLKGLSGGNKKRYHQLLKQYQHANKTLSKSDYLKGGSSENEKLYQQQIQTNQAASVNASYAFNNLQTHLKNVHQLSQKIDSTKNEKAATDLNTRMQAETAYIEVQILKQTTLLNEQIAQENADKIAGETAEAKFDRLSTGD
jgi:type IV secretion system protein VirB5